MGISLSDEIRQLLDRPNFAHLATLMPDGSPNRYRYGLDAREIGTAPANVIWRLRVTRKRP